MIAHADPLAELTGDVTPEEITASAEAHRQAADEATARAEQDTAEAEWLMTEARAQAAAIMADAEAAASVLAKSAGQARRQGEVLTEQARMLGRSADALAKAEEAQARADALQAERDQLTTGSEARAGKIAALTAERQQLAAQMEAAREAGDLDALAALAALRTRDSAAAEVIASLTGQQAAAAARIAEIGTGHETFSTHPLLRVMPPLSQALTTVYQGQRSARQGMNIVWPERREAVEDAAAEERRLTIEALRTWGAGEAAAQPRGRQRVTVDQSGPGMVIRRR